MTRYALLLAVGLILPIFSTVLLPSVHAPTTGTQYFLNSVPGFTQEGYTVVLVLTVIGALPSTTYQFQFQTKDPSGKTWTSSTVTENTTASETTFSKLITYPSPSFLGTNSLCCLYNAQVNQIKPIILNSNVASTQFYIIITDKNQYQRTETVGIRASGYNASESVSVTIRTQTTSTIVFSPTLQADSGGIISTSWKVPKNATIDNYVVTVTGTSTRKNPPDAQAFAVTAAKMTISSLTSSKATYQRTETVSFSFQASYPDGSFATTGIALLRLAPPSSGSVTLTAIYDTTSHSFTANYKTTPENQTGTWTATLASQAFGDGYGNTGPDGQLTNTPQLIPATFNISINATTYVAIGQQVKLNATITYPDGTSFTSGTGVGAYLLYSGSPQVNDTVPVIFDTGLQKWVGSYSPQSSDPGGLYSLIIKASDSASPSNTGSGTKAVTLEDKPPFATFTPSSTSGPTGSPITFDGTGSYDPDGTIVTWSWTFGDTTTGSGSLVTHTYATAGTYTVTLTVTDNGGYSSSTPSQITITDRPPAVSFSPSTTTPTSGQSVTISITGSDADGSITTTSVDWGDGTVPDTFSANAVSDSHTYTLTGSTARPYTITVTVTDNSGQTYTATSTVSIQPSSNNSSNGTLSLPLYYFGILAVIIAAILAGGFLAFRRHRVTHARLKIDLEEVKSEAGRIENQEFFQSVKDQLRKDKDG